MKKIIYIVAICLTLFFQACKEEGRVDHIDESAPAPPQVTDVTVINTNGGAVLKYKLPNDKNLLYVKAEYEIQPGVIQESKSSYYLDSLVLEGFGDTKTYPVKIYSVGRNEKMSEPLIQEVKPLTPAVLLAFDNLKLVAGFGGVTVSFVNELEANLSIVLLADTEEDNQWDQLNTFYTQAPLGSFSHRGLSEEEQKFGVYLRDRWNNTSDTLVAKVTPLFEEFIPKTNFAELHLPTDTYLPIEDRAEYSLNRAWDGITNQRNTIFATKKDSPMPQWFTFDMGVTAVVSRLKVHHRTDNYQYTDANVKKFELYGSNRPNPNGSWDESWIPLGTFEAFKPSGPGEVVTQEDKDYASIEGIDFDLAISEFAPDPFVPVRYIRFKTTETYNGPSDSGSVWIAELSFWGQIQN